MSYRDNINCLYEAVRSIDKVYENWAKTQGIGYYDMLLYYALVENEGQGMTQKQFCVELDVPKTTVNSIVKNQMQLGYIQLEINSHNRKEKIITLTPNGIEYANKLIMPLFEIEKKAISLLSQQDIDLISNKLAIFGQGLMEEM